jgi:hypothetical protein
MGNSYLLYEMTEFPPPVESAPLTVPYQQPLLDDEEPPKTSLRFERSLSDEMHLYKVRHEVRVRRAGRAKGVEFSSFVSPYDFPAYYHRPTQLLMLKAPKDIARGAMRTLTKGGVGVKGEYRKLELQSVRSQVERMRGAWFHVEDSANVTSQGLYGPDIEGDIRFDQALSEGDMSYMLIEYLFREQSFLIGISRDYAVNIARSTAWLDELAELELVMDVKRRLLDLAGDG